MGDSSPPETNERRQRVNLALNKGVLWFARQWAAILAIGFTIYAGLPFVAPIAMEAGATGVARAIYGLYSPLCHQFAFRSWYLFGDQAAYPRERALPEGDTRLSFEDAVAGDPYFNGVDINTLDEDLILRARSYVGNEEMGWKVAYCERDIAIYAMIAIGALIYWIAGLFGIRIKPLPFWAYVLIAIVPIGLDGFSQLFANPPFNGFGITNYPIRESTPFLRTLTGALFGLGNVWLAFPYIGESMEDTQELVETKLRNAGHTERGT